MSDNDSSGWAAIEELRRQLDEIDFRLVELLNERARRVAEIGKIKRAAGLPLYQPEREQSIFELVLGMNRGPLSSRALRRLFERILDESRSVERRVMEEAAGGARGATGQSEERGG
ncbi:MAG TPA: chorismate mutase [Candidatus Acidoferrales bacterium]|nr:chorismate mutase [Candidatus Acidoferrales bacterium]